MTPDKVLSIGWVFPLGEDYKPRIAWGEGSRKGIKSFPSGAPHWGLNCGKSGLVVLDVDMKGGKNGLASLAKLPPLPKTYTVRTKSGGLHYYFKGKGKNTVCQLGNGLDTRGTGGYVVIYGDVVDSSPVADLPEWIAAAIAIKEVEAPRTKGVDDLDRPVAIAEAVELATLAAPAVEGEGGDAATLRLALRLRDLGVSEETALDIMLDCWNDRCDPPWEPAELAKKISNAYKYAQNEEPGTRSREAVLRDSGAVAELVFADIPAEEKPTPEEEKPSGPRPFRISDLEYGKAPPRKWLVDGWIPLKSVCSLYGPPGGGKSMIALELGRCVATGVDWFGHKVANPCPVLYVSCEDDKDEIHFRMDGMLRKQKHSGSIGKDIDFFGWDRVGHDSVLAAMTSAGFRRKAFIEELERELGAIAPEGKPRALILDTMIDVGEFNENDRNQANYFLKVVIGGIALRHNATAIVLAHPSKSADYSGSTAMQGAVRAQLFFEYHDEDANLRWLRRGKSNRATIDKKGSGTLLQYHDGAFAEIDEEAFEKGREEYLKRAVFNMLKEAAEADNHVRRAANARNPLKANPVVDANGTVIPIDRVREIINMLIDSGVVEDDPNKGLVPLEVLGGEEPGDWEPDPF